MIDLLLKHSPSPIQKLFSSLLEEKEAQLFVKRDDQLHLEAMGHDDAFCGNKWRKLKYNLLKAKELQASTLLTFGGAFSNHIAAVAAAGKIFNFKTIGIIRGECPPTLNPTLRFAKSCGMRLKYVSRSAYREKDSTTFRSSLVAEFGSFYSIPEGGTNDLALKGAAEIPAEIEQQLGRLPDYICACCGTGGTLGGMIGGLHEKSKALGFSVLKGDFHTQEIQRLLSSKYDKVPMNWQIQTNYHFGGYAKYKTDLIDFINHFKSKHHIALDPIYTGKMFYGIFDLLQKGYFPKGSTIVAIHSGGLQGIAGFNERFGDLIDL
ncbi:MAG: pyridoxal-phosphate dependent enzyme [Saprospiraceae bacterium]|nr:pyridoxal-phosphate dependent enzyme [Saprospiraceae bacterium]